MLKSSIFSDNRISMVTVRTLFAALLVSGPIVPSTGAAQDGDGGTRSVFSVGAGSRAIGLGGAFVSLVDDASAVYWNPAGLRDVGGKQFIGMYMPLYNEFTGASYTFFGAAYPTLEAGAFGVGFMRVSSTFDGYDAQSRPTGEGEYSESQMMFAYAFEKKLDLMRGSLATGLSFKIVNQKVTPYSSTSPGIDLGIRYLPEFARGFAFAVNLQDLSGATHHLVSENDKTYRTILAGLGYTRVFGNGSALRLMIQMDVPEKANSRFHAGAEYAFSRYVALRVGMDGQSVTFGLGVNVSSYGLDYAFLSRETAGASHPISFTTQYGRTLFEERQVLEERRAAEEQLVIQRAFKNRVQSHRENAGRHESSGDLARALDEWKIVLEYVPDDEEAKRRLEDLADNLVKEQERATTAIEERAAISAHFSQGLRLYRQNEYVRAREEWRVVLDFDSTHAGAREYLRKTEEKVAVLIDERMDRASKLEMQGRIVEAIGEWNYVAMLDPGNKGASAAAARMRKRIELQGEDLQHTATQLKIITLYNGALHLYNSGNFEKAIAELEEILRLDPNHEEAKKLLALAKRKTTPLTSEEQEKIKRLYLKGMQYFSNDEYARAIAEWEKILDIDPGNESVKRNIQEARDRLEQLGRRPE